MADLIELDLVVRDKGLKQSLTTVERLERQIVKAAKAVDSNRISQDRYNKILLQSKRDYQALGMSSQQATATVRKFAEAQRTAAQTTNTLTGAVNQQTKAQMAATKGSNRMGVVTQQAGYQVSDFIVQVQSGTNAFVAFGQQASQLVGVLPLMAGSFGLTAGAAVGLSAGLGIVIPLLTAVGAAFTRSSASAKEAAQDVTSFKDAIAGLRSELEFLQSGAETREVLQLNKEIAAVENQIYDIKNRTIDLSYADAETKKLILEATEANSQATSEELKTLQAQLTELKMKRDAIRINKGLAGSEVQEQQNLLENQRRINRERVAAAKKAKEEQEELLKLTLQVANVPVYEPMSATARATQEANAEMVEGFNSAMRLKEQLGEGAYEALRLAGVDMTGGIDAAAKAAAILAGNLKISLAAAQAMQSAGRGRGGDPREMGGRIIDWNTREAIAYEDALKNINKTTKKLGSTTKKTLTDAEKAAEAYAKALDDQVIGAIGGVADAWGDFVVRGFSDFKGFVSSVLNSFKSMLSNMIAMAAKNKIMLSLGIGGVGSGSVASAAGSIGGTAGNSILSGGGMLSGTAVGAGISAIGTGLSSGFMSSVYGGLGGMSGAISGGLSVGGLGGVATAIGAIAAPLLAVAAVFSFFKKKVKELDSGLQGTITTLDATIESFKTLETKRFWGLSKKVRTSAEALDAEAAEPLLEAIRGIQQGVMDAADMFGIASDVFDKFSYEFKLSLKGLSEDEQIQKVNEELEKMGDSFASLTGHFETMNELLEAANQRMQLQNRLDQLLGNNQAILARQREAELSAMHELNRPLAQAIYQLEDAQAVVQNAFASLGASIEAEKNRLRDAFTSIVEGLKERLDVANEAMSRSSSIYQMLESAVSGRSVTSGIGQAFARREGALNFIRGGNFSDEKRLEEALDTVSEPTEDLFGSFVDYARDFARTSITLEEAKKVAQVQLTADEKSVLLLEEQITQAQTDLDAQLDALDQQYQMMVDQYNALLGIDTSVKGVTEAIGTLRGAIEALAAAQAAAKAAAAAGVGGAGTGSATNKSFAEQFGTGTKYQGYDYAEIKSAAELKQAAASLGLQTSGKTGAQIQQDIANASKMAVGMKQSIRAQQFAMGGYHTGGLRMVGERGPELEATGPSRIFSHNQTASMFRDPDLKDAVRSLKEEVAGLRTEQRQIQMGISKYTKRSYDIERKWDVDGLPATRT